MVRTYYDVLGVEETASTAEIEAAYRERLKETHPDVTDDPDATDTVQTVIDARDALADEDERARYDRLGHEAYVGDAPTATGATGTAREPSTGTASGGSRDSSGDTRSAAGSSSKSSSEGPFASQAHPSSAGGSARRGTRPRWSETGEAAVSDESVAVRWNRLFPPGQSVVLLLAAFVCYPPFVLFSVYPPFPTVFNLVVAACTIALVAYLISLPTVGVVVFGFWGLVVAGAIATGQLPAVSVPGVLAMTATWLPLGLSVLVFRLLRSD